jgi:multidrug efflux pump subunit AcrB
LGKLESLNVFSSVTGTSVPLKQVADIEVVWQPAKILRRDCLKTVTVQADIQTGASAMAITRKMDQWLQDKAKSWDIGYRHEMGGEFEESSKANQSLLDQLPLAGFIIIFLLVFQFNSLRRPLIILITIPLGMIGVTIGLIVMRSYFGFMTFLGVISLAGIVINNAIVLLDRIKIEIEENGLEPHQAVVEAAQKRFRPILLTTVTTIGGLIPLYISGGPMWEPMAVAIIFGILFATVLTLCVVPVLYAILFRVDFKGYTYQIRTNSSQ